MLQIDTDKLYSVLTPLYEEMFKELKDKEITILNELKIMDYSIILKEPKCGMACFKKF